MEEIGGVGGVLVAAGHPLGLNVLLTFCWEGLAGDVFCSALLAVGFSAQLTLAGTQPGKVRRSRTGCAKNIPGPPSQELLEFPCVSGSARVPEDGQEVGHEVKRKACSVWSNAELTHTGIPVEA